MTGNSTRDATAGDGKIPRRRGIIDFGWTTVHTWMGILVQVILMIILSRLITPAEFGEYGVALAYMSIIMMLAQLGLSPGVVRSRYDAVRSAKTAAGIALVTSAVSFSGLFALLSWTEWIPAGGRSSAELLAALSTVLLIAPMRSVSIGLLQRWRRFATMAIIGIAALLVQAAVSLSCAFAGWGAWALVYGFISQQITLAAASWGMTLLLPAFHRREAIELLRFSFGFVWLTVIDTASNSLDRLVVSAAAGTTAVGFYQRAANVRTIGNTVAMSPVDVLFFPRLSASLDAPDALRREFRYAYAIALLLSAPISIGISVAAGEWTTILFGEPWRPAAPLLQIMALVLPFRALERVNAVLARSAGCQGVRIAIQITLLALTLLALHLLAATSLIFAVSAVSLIMIFMTLPGCLLSASILGVTPSKLLRAVLPQLGLWAGGLCMGFAVQAVLVGSVSGWAAALVGAVGASLTNFLICLCAPRLLFAEETTQLIEQVRNHVFFRVAQRPRHG